VPRPQLFWQQSVLQDLGEQRVRKPVRAIRADHEYTGVYRLTQQWNYGAVKPKHIGDFPKAGRGLGPSPDRDQPRQFARRLRQALPRMGRCLAQICRQIRWHRCRVGWNIADDQPGQVGIAPSSTKHCIYQRLVRWTTQQTLDLIRGGDAVEPTEGYFVDSW
jgi:hypothetical protein